MYEKNESVFIIFWNFRNKLLILEIVFRHCSRFFWSNIQSFYISYYIPYNTFSANLARMFFLKEQGKLTVIL